MQKLEKSLLLGRSSFVVDFTLKVCTRSHTRSKVCRSPAALDALDERDADAAGALLAAVHALAQAGDEVVVEATIP